MGLQPFEVDIKVVVVIPATIKLSLADARRGFQVGSPAPELKVGSRTCRHFFLAYNVVCPQQASVRLLTSGASIDLSDIARSLRVVVNKDNEADKGAFCLQPLEG